MNPKTGKSYTVADVHRDTGISPSAITQLKTGAKPNPTLKTVEALADYFGVETNYFTKQMSEEHVRRVVAGLELLAAAENSGVQALFARASGLSDQSLDMVRAVIETARKADGLDTSGGS
ncbi:helix-turn-helix transcriptional regulator [Streptomyces avermitilis]|uniref:helix-turn-helix domain-containing protein n=1 Tax=Streptomyces avermitilis TaxID=33903 RepID=UPI0033E5AA7D